MRFSVIRSEAGATAIEYAIIGALIGIGLVGALVGTKGSLSAIFGTAAGEMATATATAPTLKLNSALPRAAYWAAKTLSGPVTVAQEQNSLGIYKTIRAQFTDGSSLYLYYDINGKNYNINTKDPASNAMIVLNADASGYPGNANMNFYSTNPDGSSYLSKSYSGDNRQIYSADGYDKGYPLLQNTYLYASNGSQTSSTNGDIGNDFKTAIQNAEADAVLFRNSGY